MGLKSKQKLPPKDSATEVQLDDPLDFTHPALALLDSSLRCPLCHELLSAPVIITSCSHSFCSLCIRQSLDIKRECPLDHLPADQGRIRPNKQLDEVIHAWTAARSALLTLQSFSTAAALAEQDPQPSTSKARSSTADPTLPDDAEASRPHGGYATRSRGAQGGGSNGSGKNKGKGKPVELEDDSSDIEIVEERPSRSGWASAMAQHGKNTGKGKSKASNEDPSDPNIIVLCPMCQGSFRNLELNRHIDKCDGTKPPATNGTHAGGSKEGWGFMSSTSAGSRPSGTSSSGTKEQGAGAYAQFDTTKPLPLSSYSGLKVAALKKKLEDLSLPTALPSALTTTDSKISFLRRRHQQWTTLWNANTDVDSKDPRHKSQRELVKELTRWEEMMDASEKVEIEGKTYSKAHESDFRTLIAQARASSLAKKQQQEDSAAQAELASELGELREEVASQEVGGGGEKEEGGGDEEMKDEDEEEEVRKQLRTRTSSTVRFAASPPHTSFRSTPPLSSPTPTTHTLTHTTVTASARSPSPTGSLSASPSPSPPRVLDHPTEEEMESRKRKREFSPYDPRGPRPSQMVRGEEGWSGGLSAEDEEEEEEDGHGGEGMEE